MDDPGLRQEATVVIRRLDDLTACQAMEQALASPFGVADAALIHPGMGREFSRTLLLLEGDDVAARAEGLIAQLATFGAKHALTGEDSRRMWRAIREGTFLAEPHDLAIWRTDQAPLEALAALGPLAQATVFHRGLWFSAAREADVPAVLRRAQRVR